MNSNAGSSRAASPDVFESSANTCKEPSDCSELIPAEEGFVYAVFVSFAEIYNETVYDLLERLPPGCRKRTPHLLGEDKHGASYIKGLYDVRVDSASEALRVLEVGRQNLHFAATRLNHNSSRSHCIFTVKLIHLASLDTPKFARVSMFSICDLAGAERVAKTQGSGERLKEAGNINTSLLVLSRCIVALRSPSYLQ
ncbi:Kinesin motor domain [Trinorchestia longiramus]|nr:Kinesin motor domain [Trinorchestia longiramus]